LKLELNSNYYNELTGILMTLQQVLLSLPGDSDCGLLSCDTTYISTHFSEAYSSEIMASAYKTTQCHNPDDHNVNNYCCENIKIYIHQASETNDELLYTLRTVINITLDYTVTYKYL
jgi:hypothetical protein